MGPGETGINTGGGGLPPAWFWAACGALLAGVVVSNGLVNESLGTRQGWEYYLVWVNIVLLAVTSAAVGQSWREYTHRLGTWKTWLAGATTSVVASLALLAVVRPVP